MREFRRKQRIVKRIMNAFVITTAVLLFILIGIEPMFKDGNAAGVGIALHYLCEALVIISLALVLYYYSKYSKSDTFLTNVEYELSDCGYYITKKDDDTVDGFYKSVRTDLINNAFSISENLELTELDFALRGVKRKELVYVVTTDVLDKNDVVAHLDSVVYDITAGLMRRMGDVLLIFICDKAEEDAVALSKTITVLGKKERLRVALAIAEVESGRAYFLGNNPTKCQQMAASYVLGTEVPIADSLKGERLKFQDELEEKMKDFDLNEYTRGNFFSH
ncbi:MAG: hypothetical protein E7571_07820 [Ruminococcaceae bacterium]|nr:hypothetical protein [Oscillospiraceae bacterium]